VALHKKAMNYLQTELQGQMDMLKNIEETTRSSSGPYIHPFAVRVQGIDFFKQIRD
jgi:hypothetical protein